jgi:hypothetical protein
MVNGHYILKIAFLRQIFHFTVGLQLAGVLEEILGIRQ